ncbi:DUF4350 domain-containing protein [Microbacterium sp. NPDC089189]|uniref:DUF4350 domain-containing protein n=1 Tax=Microbacterium sp. NPDC089189 TaxID=3154972 RepID=UPI0034402C49
MSTLAPAPPSRLRRVIGWGMLVAVLIGAGIVGATVSGAVQWTERDRFDPDSAGPGGTRALARILEQQGVDVEIVRSLDAARQAVTGSASTLLLPDSPFVSDAAFEHLADAADDVVVADVRSRGLRVLFNGTVAGFGPTEPVPPACDLEAAERAGAIVVGAALDAPEASGCYAVDGGYGLLWSEENGHRRSAIDATALFTNDALAQNGNAALAISLLGRHDRVVWFVPTLADADAEGAAPATLGELTPDWVSPAVVLLAVVAIGAALWRGRRFGPLVFERLPVTVRGGETTRGRARLYARGRDTEHAAERLRDASLRRLARALGLGGGVDAQTVADAVATATGDSRESVHAALVSAPVPTDRALVDLSSRLHALEAATGAALRPRKDQR